MVADTRPPRAWKIKLCVVQTILLVFGLSLYSDISKALLSFKQYESFISPSHMRLANSGYALGIVMCITAVFGYLLTIFSGFTRSVLSIIAYSYVMAGILIVQLTRCVTGFILKWSAEEFSFSMLKSQMELYGVVEYSTLSWDVMQANLQCCGVSQPEDWFPYLGGNSTLPLSCCRIPSIDTIQICTAGFSYKQGCGEEFTVYLQDTLHYMAASAGCIAFFQAVLIIYTLYTVSKAKKEENDSELLHIMGTTSSNTTLNTILKQY